MKPNSPALEGRNNIFLHDMHKIALDVILTHMSANKGINKYG